MGYKVPILTYTHRERNAKEGRKRKEKVIENVTVVICSEFKKSPLKVFKPNPANVTRKNWLTIDLNHVKKI